MACYRVTFTFTIFTAYQILFKLRIKGLRSVARVSEKRNVNKVLLGERVKPRGKGTAWDAHI